MKYSSRTLAGMVASSFGLFGIAHAATVVTTTFLDNNAARRANPQGFYRIRSL